MALRLLHMDFNNVAATIVTHIIIIIIIIIITFIIIIIVIIIIIFSEISQSKGDLPWLVREVPENRRPFSIS